MIFAFSAFIIAAYLLGATPFMIWMGRAKGHDLSHEPDLHFALWHNVSRPLGALGLILDMLKGAIPVLISYFCGFPLLVTVISGLAALCGQMWPVFRRFDGEHGNTTGVGAGMTLCFVYNEPLVFIIIFAIVAAGFFIRLCSKWKENNRDINESLKLKGSPSRSFPLSCFIGFLSMPVTSALLGLPVEATLCYAGIFLLIVIRRISDGLRADLKKSNQPVRVVINRMLYDRSEA